MAGESNEPSGLVRVEASSLQEAMQRISERYGEDVSIVHTRVVRRKGVLGALGVTGVEVYVTGRSEYEEWRDGGNSARNVGRGTSQPSHVLAAGVLSDSASSDSSSRIDEVGRFGAEALRLGERYASGSQVPAPVRAGKQVAEVRASKLDAAKLDAAKVDASAERSLQLLQVLEAARNKQLAAASGESAGAAGVTPRVPPQLDHLLKHFRGELAQVNRSEGANPSAAMNPAAISESSIPSIIPEPKTRSAASGAVSLGGESLACAAEGSVISAGDATVLDESSSARRRPRTPRVGEGGRAIISEAQRLLEDADCSLVTMRELLDRLRNREFPGTSGDPREIRSLARIHLGELIRPKLPPCIPIRVTRGQGPRVVAIAGPTGVGKTTTIAKLASPLHLIDRVKVGLITLDTYRIGAIDQLRRFAEILSIPLEVVDPGSSARDAVNRLRHCDVIFLDTAGRSQKDAHRLAEMPAMLDGIGGLEVHLCVSMTSSRRTNMEVLEKFKVLPYDRLLITKLDESGGQGALLDLFRVARTPVSFVTCGQEVPDDIRAASVDLLESLILGE